MKSRHLYCLVTFQMGRAGEDGHRILELFNEDGGNCYPDFRDWRVAQARQDEYPGEAFATLDELVETLQSFLTGEGYKDAYCLTVEKYNELTINYNNMADWPFLWRKGEHIPRLEKDKGGFFDRFF